MFGCGLIVLEIGIVMRGTCGPGSGADRRDDAAGANGLVIARRTLRRRPWRRAATASGRAQEIARHGRVHRRYNSDGSRLLLRLRSAGRVVHRRHDERGGNVDEPAIDKVVRMIIDTYLPPNKSFRDLKALVDDDAVDPLRAFGNACREEMGGQRGS